MLSPVRSSAFPPGSLFQEAAAEAAAAAAGASGGAAAAAGGAAAAAAEFLDLLSRGLSTNPADRPPIDVFTTNKFLLSLEARALKFLTFLHEKEQQQQQQFLAGLLPLLQQQQQLQQPQVLRVYVLDPLLAALKYPSLLPSLLPNIFWVLKKVKQQIIYFVFVFTFFFLITVPPSLVSCMHILCLCLFVSLLVFIYFLL